MEYGEDCGLGSGAFGSLFLWKAFSDVTVLCSPRCTVLMEEENESLFAFLKMIFQLLCFPEVFYTAIFYEGDVLTCNCEQNL